MTANVTVTAVFALNSSPSFAVTVSVRGSASGTVTSNPAGITNCAGTCTASYISGTPLLLTAAPGAGATFKQWGGACGGATTCTVTVDAAKSVTATFSQTFTDGSGANGTVSGQITVIKAVHVTELRSAIDKLRAVNGLGGFTWTDSTPTPGLTVVKRAHFTDLRTALSQAYQAAAQTAPSFTDSSISPGLTIIKASHLNELRNGVRALE